MNVTIRHRFCRISVIAIAILAVSVPQMLVAQSVPGGLAETPAAPTGQLKTLAVLAGARYEKLISDIGYLGSLAGKPESGQMLEGMFSLVSQGKGPNLLDKSKSWGLIVQTDGAGFFPVICVPVAKVDEVLEIAKGYGAEVKDAENGAKHLALPNGKSFYLKSQGDVMFVSIAAASLERLPANALEILAKKVGEYDISAVIAVKNLPAQYREAALATMQAGLHQGMKQLPKESDEEFAERQRLTEAQMAQMKTMINEIDAVTIGWAVDAQKQLTYLDFEYKFVQGSKMAERMAAYGNAHTNFAGFHQSDAAGTMSFATKADPKLAAEDLAQLEGMMKNLRTKTNKELDKSEKISDPAEREALKAAASDVFDAIEETIKQGQLDGGASLNVSPDSMTLIAGVHVKDPSKLESALKKVEPAAKKAPDFSGIKWNAANHAGVNFHTLTVPVPEKENGPRQVFGDHLDVAIGIGPDAVYLAAGKDNMNAINKAIDASAAEKEKAIPPFEATLSLQPIMEFAAAQGDSGQAKEAAKAIADVLKKQGQGHDHVRVISQMVPNGLRYHIEAEEGVLRAIGAAAAKAQQQRLQANQ